MTIRWMEGAGRLDTSRGSRFMRAEADLNPTTHETESDPRPSAPIIDTQVEPQPDVEVTALPQPRQVRATLDSTELRRNAV
jgi:hypothetical protein